MSDETSKPCPFCGQMSPYGDKFCDDCIDTNENVGAWIDNWNNRPIEDALKAQIAELEAEVVALKPVSHLASEELPEEEKKSCYSRSVVARDRFGCVFYDVFVGWDGLPTWYNCDGDIIDDIIDWWEMPAVPPRPEVQP